MDRRRLSPLILAAAACAHREPATTPAPAPAAAPEPVSTAVALSSPPRLPSPPRTPPSCTPDPAFPSPWDVPEASAAAEVVLSPGVRELLVLSDSGNHGAAMAWRIPSGGQRSLTLPLDEAASDDIEGAAWRGGHLYTLTSSGAVRRFSPDGRGGLARDQDAYPIAAPPRVCDDLRAGNCGFDYEGLCLRSEGPANAVVHCVGYAASRAHGTLQCLVFERDHIVIDTAVRALKLDVPRKALSDCAFGAAGGPAADRLLVTTNVFGGSTTYEVGESDGALTSIGVMGTLSNEVVAVDKNGALYLFMDDNGPQSFARRLTCSGW